MSAFLGWLLGAVVWTLGNVIYRDLRRRGVRRHRVLAFFVGYPGTLISLLTLPEGDEWQLEPPPDDEEERLLREIRVDLELREGRLGPLIDEGSGGQEWREG